MATMEAEELLSLLKHDEDRTWGCNYLNLANFHKVEPIQGHTTHIYRSGVVITTDRDRTIEDGLPKDESGWNCKHRSLRRRWSVNCSWNTTWTAPDQPPNKASQAISKDDAQKIDKIIGDSLLRKLPPTDRDKIYLENATITLHKKSFDLISQPGVWQNDNDMNSWFHGSKDTWFDGDVINTGFDLLERIFKCKDHGIALLNVNFAFTVFQAGYHLEKGLQGVEELIKKIGKSTFIFIPISDGWVEGVENAKEDEELEELKAETRALDYSQEMLMEIFPPKHKVLRASGKHWSVLVVDCRNRVVTARYFDSWGRGGYKGNIETVPIICRGLSRVLDKMWPNFYHLDPEAHDKNASWDPETPSQKFDNACTSDANGACGPFVYAITKELTQYIVECGEDEKRLKKPVPISIALPKGFREEFKWDSAKTRKSLSRLIERERRTRIHLNETHEWWDDKHTATPGWRSWLQRHVPELPVDYFWDPYECGPTVVNGGIHEGGTTASTNTDIAVGAVDPSSVASAAAPKQQAKAKSKAALSKISARHSKNGVSHSAKRLGRRKG